MRVFVRGHRAVMSALLLAVVVCFSPFHLSAATTVVVHPANTTACISGFISYTSIQAAVTAVTLIPGSTVKVCPGSYQEQVNITSKLTLTGVPGLGAALVLPPAGGLVQNGFDIFGSPVAAQIFVDSPGSSNLVTIEHVTVDGTGNLIAGCGAPTMEGIYFQNTYGTITNNTVRNQFQTDYTDYGGCQNGLAINVESLTTSSVVTVSNNSVRSYQKNGITATGAATGAGSAGPNVTISGNRIVGLAATAMNWPTSGAAENGVQFGFGASGKVTGNTVNDNIWGQDVFGDTGDAASGILIYASPNIMVTSNYVGSAQFGIVPVSDPTYGPADNTTITGNNLSGTQLYDAIDICSNGNTVKSNLIYGSGESGVHVDDTCGGTGNNNTVEGNTINEACAGILLGTGTGNIYGPPNNTFNNVTNTTLAGDVCATGPSANSTGEPAGKHPMFRPSPYKPVRK
jgi:hypothetical protein